VLVAGIGLGADGTDEPIALSRAAAFDPLGSPPGEEHNAEAPLAIDGNGATAWTTETYRDPARLGKPGVGLVVRLDHETSVRTLRVVSGSVNWSASIYTTSGEPGADLAAWGDPVAGASGLGPPGASFSLHGTRAAAVLIWITRVGDDGLVRVAEVQAAG
jgi:putative peptidoglycan lipid II flippase